MQISNTRIEFLVYCDSTQSSAECEIGAQCDPFLMC